MTDAGARAAARDRHTESEPGAQQATLGGGCFWCLEPIFARLQGVTTVEPGYAGGTVEDPTYEQVCAGTSGHAEVVQLTFDPDAVSFGDLLQVFFAIHDPTTPNRQGADVGPQYRSIILYDSEDQRRTAAAVVDELEASDTWQDPIVTELKPLRRFYAAEGYHHDYYEKHPGAPYCRFVIRPKLETFRRRFGDRLADT